MTEKDILSMHIWQSMINSLSNIIEHPASSHENFEGYLYYYTF